jgi:hypothetical protein
MVAFALGILALGLAIWASGAFLRADPKALARGLRLSGGMLAVLGAMALALTGRFLFAIPLAVFGLGLLGIIAPRASLSRRTQSTPGQISRVRTAFVEMELDLDTGAMRGVILAGPHEGRALDEIDVETLAAAVEAIDADSAQLLAAYLDRRQPGWRETTQPHPDAGRSDGEGGRRGPITTQEAYEILGLQPGAPANEIRRAHRDLMKKLHPDKGGSTYLAARVNEAKDFLLRDHT